MNDIVTVAEAAAFLRKHPGTIRRWIEENKLTARRLSAGRHGVYAIARSDLLEFMVSHDIEAKERTKRAASHKRGRALQRSLPL